MVQRVAVIVAVMWWLLWAGAGTAAAAITEPARTCKPGSNGNVCITVRTDGVNVRSRVGLDAPEFLGASICLDYVRLYLTPWEGGGTTRVVASRTTWSCIQGGHQSFYTPVVRLQFGEYCSFAHYAVFPRHSNLGNSYYIKTCWSHRP